MGRNSVIGFVLIFALLGGYMWYNAPSKEQLAAQKRQQDSIALVQKNQASNSQVVEKTTNAVDVKTSNDSLKKAMAGSFASTQSGAEVTKVLENDVVKVTLSNFGGVIKCIELKNYKTFDGKPLVLANEKTFAEGLEFYNNKNML